MKLSKIIVMFHKFRWSVYFKVYLKDETQRNDKVMESARFVSYKAHMNGRGWAQFYMSSSPTKTGSHSHSRSTSHSEQASQIISLIKSSLLVSVTFTQRIMRLFNVFGSANVRFVDL